MGAFDEVLDGLTKASAANVRSEDGDYIGESGLLHCGKCHTPKQTDITVFGNTRRVMCLCKCATEKRDREQAEREKQEFANRVKRARKAGFPESCMEDWTFANDDGQNPKLTAAMQRYVQNFTEMAKRGKGLLLYGSTGTGKTFAACEVANALIDQGIPVLVTNFARILNTLQDAGGRQEYIDSLNRYKLLVIDDLGIERNTEYAKEQVYNVVDNRYRAGLPMVITTNLSMEKMNRPEDMENLRIYDRILERCYPIKVDGMSRRKKAVIDEREEMRELLGL